MQGQKDAVSQQLQAMTNSRDTAKGQLNSERQLRMASDQLCLRLQSNISTLQVGKATLVNLLLPAAPMVS